MTDWYSVEEIAPSTYRISEFGWYNAYLIVGEERALLVDSGAGTGNLRKVVTELTDKPVIAAATHRHPDHIGAMWQFDWFYAHPAERNWFTTLINWYPIRWLGIKRLNQVNLFKKPFFKWTKVVPMRDEMHFDLGNRIIEAVCMPGHTHGSVVFIDSTEKILLVGDDSNPEIWLQLPDAVPVTKWLLTGQRLLDYAHLGYRIYSGHEEGIVTIEQMERHMEIAHHIISQYQQHAIPRGYHFYPESKERPCIVYRRSNID